MTLESSKPRIKSRLCNLLFWTYYIKLPKLVTYKLINVFLSHIAFWTVLISSLVRTESNVSYKFNPHVGQLVSFWLESGPCQTLAMCASKGVWCLPFITQIQGRIQFFLVKGDWEMAKMDHDNAWLAIREKHNVCTQCSSHSTISLNTVVSISPLWRLRPTFAY